ncbi:MAG: peptidoglycan DD-metalloendopeptidase family protein, partial [Gemmiger sp.]|nr:peptidoglycan DD-metalloendopeptidase family protein [Gemmiger sp.]
GGQMLAQKAVRQRRERVKASKPLEIREQQGSLPARKAATEKPHLHSPQKAAKTAPNTIRGVTESRRGMKTAQAAIQADRAATAQTAQMTARSRQMARQAAETLQKASAATKSAIRWAVESLKALIAAAAAGGSVALLVVLLVCMIALVAGSAYGIFFAGESPGEGAMTAQDAVALLTEEYRDRLEDISRSVPHDREELTANDDVYYIQWQNVLAVFSATNAGDANGMSVSFIEESQLDALRQTMWDMNGIACSTYTEEIEVPVENPPEDEEEEEEPQTRTVTRTVLVISLEHKTPEEMRQEYHMTSRQEESLTLLCDPDTEQLWGELLGGFAAGSLDGEILTPGGSFDGGSLQWPLPVAGSITSPFGYRTDPITGEISYHSGTDIAAPNGTPILAAADGTVVTANGVDSWGGSYGYYVKLDHGNGLQTLYAHCSSICVATGQQVQAGQVIGYVGHTGRATGDHLHFEVYENGQRTDAMRQFS